MEPLLGTFGGRKTASGMLTLSPDKRLGFCRRTAGNALYVATLLPALDPYNPKRENVKLDLAMILGVTVPDVLAVRSVSSRHGRGTEPVRDYRDRSGFPSGLESAKSNARRSASDRFKDESTGFERAAFGAPP